MIALGIELKKRGHQIRFTTMDFYREKIEMLGFEYAPMAPHMDPEEIAGAPELMDAKTGTETILRDIILPSVRPMFDDLMIAIDGADLFITGLGGGPELPIVLALLSVAGVLLGILLRVRAFLLLGVAFLFLDVFSQIWHAAVDRSQTWVWWASGIVLGAAILTLFALFEKRRNDVLQMLAEIKRWQ